MRASLRLPEGFTPATSLHVDRATAGVVKLKPVSWETLVDSPVYAGRYARSLDIGRIGDASIGAAVFSDTPHTAAASGAHTARLKALLRETQAVFGPPLFRRYTFLMSLSDSLPSTGSREHLSSSEINFAPDFLAESAENLMYRDLIAHELVHSWKGKSVTPESLWTPDFNTPSADDLPRIYEGQTEYWGLVLAARAGLRTRQETLDYLAVRAAEAKRRTGRSWKSLADSSLDPVRPDSGALRTRRIWRGPSGSEGHHAGRLASKILNVASAVGKARSAPERGAVRLGRRQVRASSGQSPTRRLLIAG